MKAVAREKLQQVADVVGEQVRLHTPAAAIIKLLVDQHGARHVCQPSGNRLSVAGVTSTCTWSKDDGLIGGWRRLATRRLAMERQS